LKVGNSSPALRPLVLEIERWAEENAEAAKTTEVNRIFAAGERRIELDLYVGDENGIRAKAGRTVYRWTCEPCVIWACAGSSCNASIKNASTRPCSVRMTTRVR